MIEEVDEIIVNIMMEYSTSVAKLHWPLIERLMLQGLTYEDANKMSAIALTSLSGHITGERTIQ